MLLVVVPIIVVMLFFWYGWYISTRIEHVLVERPHADYTLPIPIESLWPKLWFA